MTNKDKPHGALGSNKPLERVPVPEEIPLADEGISLTVEKTEEIISEVSVATSSATKDDGDVVYLREDLRR